MIPYLTLAHVAAPLEELADSAGGQRTFDKETNAFVSLLVSHPKKSTIEERHRDSQVMFILHISGVKGYRVLLEGMIFSSRTTGFLEKQFSNRVPF